MAFSIRKREEKRHNASLGLLDAALMQRLQDRFCDANNVYLACLSRSSGVITKAYGSREELAYIHGLVTMDMHVSLMTKLMDSTIESVMEENCGTELVKLCGVSIKVGGEVAATWIVIGIMEDEAVHADVPDCVMKTNPERYYKSLEFLETLSRQLFAVKMEEQIAQEAFIKSRESAAQMEAELHRNEVMTAIVKMLESENAFDAIVDEILKNVCEYLDVATGALLQEKEDAGLVEMICEYVSPGTESARMRWSGVGRDEVPFFNGKPYMISANSMMPDEFHRFFEQGGITAGIFLPIDVSGHTGMYLCFCEKGKERIWDVSDIKFVSDVKRIIQSILMKRIASNSLASSYASLEAILENVGCGIYVKDPVNENILYMNQRFQEAFCETGGKDALEAYIAAHPTGSEDSYFQEIHWEQENRWFDFHRTHISWVDGRTVLLCTVYDVTDKKLYQQKIEKQANNDFLTGLYNRMRFERDLESRIRQTKESGGEGALLYIDLDDFNNINEGLGHHYGDMLLKNISESLKQIPGVENNCYRIGGDEFVIILSHRHVMMLQQILDEIKALFTTPWMLKETDYYCTMSMGIVRFPTDGESVEELVRKADIAMHAAKSTGRNRVEFYDGNVESSPFMRLDLEKNMRNATRDSFSEFEVRYQPIVDITEPGMPCVGAEALVRWNSDELGTIAPADFIPLAEYLGLINPIGDFVLREACRRCKYWNDMGHPDYRVNVNLSVIQMLQGDIVDKVRRAIEESGILPGNLTLEVTESLAINDISRMKTILSDIHSLGVKVAPDDFGTGYSSLNHIREMPIDVIKIDRCFVVDLGKDEFQMAFVRIVAELAGAIGVRVCAEGVETKEQLAALQGTKIQMVQGFHFGKPLPLEEFEEKYL